MRPHLNQNQIRSLASRYVASSNESGEQVTIPAHVHRCERCLEAFTDELNTLAWLRTHLADLDAPGVMSEAQIAQRQERQHRRRRIRGRVRSVSAGLAAMFAVVLMSRAVGDGTVLPVSNPGPGSSTIGEIAGIGVPISSKVKGGNAALSGGHQTLAAGALQLPWLRSAPFAVRNAKLNGQQGQLVRMSAGDFLSDILPKLDPVDQWRVHQSALAALGYYPYDDVDGLYGKRTKAALRAFFKDSSEELPALQKGLLPTTNASKLFSGFADVVLALGGTPSSNTAPSQQPGQQPARYPEATPSLAIAMSAPK